MYLVLVYGSCFIYMYIHNNNINNTINFAHTLAHTVYVCAVHVLYRDLLDSSIQRGGTVRSSLQAQKRTDLSNSRRNSVHGYALLNV